MAAWKAYCKGCASRRVPKIRGRVFGSVVGFLALPGGKDLPVKARRQNFQTISWFWDLWKRELLDLDPPYQRRSVWNQAYKDSFVDTILLQYPAPAIFLYEEVSPQGTSKYHVVDGKQRLTAVFEFASGSFPVSEASIVSHLRGKQFNQLPDDEKTAFWTYQFSVEYLPTNEETIVNSIFERINRNTAKLSRQELRHARFGGQFISLAEEMADLMPRELSDGFPRIEDQSRKQMKDVELVASLLLYFRDGIRGYSQDELDQAFSDLDAEWEDFNSTRETFLRVLGCLGQLVKRPEASPVYKTRLRNQADFYSLFVAVANLLSVGRLVCTDEGAATRLARFLSRVEDEQQRVADPVATAYFTAARSNSNDAGPRRTRTEILTTVLQGSP